MRKNILTKLLLGAFASLAIISCEEDFETTSQVTSFKQFDAEIAGGSALVISECDAGTYTVDFAFSGEAQNTDIHVEIAIGPGTTAKEHVDFDLLTHDFSLLAYEGQDGFSVDLEIYEDFSEDDAATEDIFLTFTSTDPSGVSRTEVKVITIEDSGEEPAIAEGSYTSTLNPAAATYWFGIANPQTKTVTVTKTGTGTYAITDVSSGAYAACCGFAANQPVVIAITGCNEIRIASETGEDVIGQSAKSLGTFDPATNTFTVYWADSFGSDDDPDPGALLFSTFVLQD